MYQEFASDVEYPPSLMPIRGCGFCFRLFNDIDIERCDNCRELLCNKCVPVCFTRPCNLHDDEDVKHYFCTKTCRDGFDFCESDTCTDQWALRLKVYAPHPSQQTAGGGGAYSQ